MEEATESKVDQFAKLEWFTIAKITFPWRGLKFRRCYDPPLLLPMIAIVRQGMYLGKYKFSYYPTYFKCQNGYTDLNIMVA